MTDRDDPTPPPPRPRRPSLPEPRELEFAPRRPRLPSRPADDPPPDWEDRVAALSAREARVVVGVLLEGLDERVRDIVDDRMKEWLSPVQERLDAIARQQGVDVDKRIEHERFLAERHAAETADQRIRDKEEEFRKEREHFVRLSLDLTNRQKLDAPTRVTKYRLKDVAAVIGSIAILLGALGSATLWSQCRGPVRVEDKKIEAAK